MSINADPFKIFNTKQELISSDSYEIDFAKALLIIHKENNSNITVEYYRCPEFLTKVHSLLSKDLIVSSTINKKKYKLFDAVTN